MNGKMKLMFQTTRYPFICHKMPGVPHVKIEAIDKNQIISEILLDWSSGIIIPNVVGWINNTYLKPPTSCTM